MPEMTVVVRWPDHREEECYSPSLVMHDHLEEGSVYTVDDFAQRSSRALSVASDRVHELLGFACTSAAATTEQIRRSAAAYPSEAHVVVTRMWPPLPAQQETA